MNIKSKIVFLVMLAASVRIVSSCCDCDNLPAFFNFNKADLRNIDNSGDYPFTITSDSMYAEAVAFEVSIFDSTGYYYLAENRNPLNNLGFSTASAFSCDCAMPFTPNQFIERIEITTLYPLNTSTPAGSNVSELFVGLSTSNSARGYVYETLSQLCQQTQGKIYYDGGIESFRLFLKPAVENPVARFQIQLHFSDGSQMALTTGLIHIID